MKFSQFTIKNKKSKSFEQPPGVVIIIKNLNKGVSNSTTQLGKAVLGKLILGKGV